MHLLYIEHGRVLGYQRMLPSTRPHLLSEVMPELCEVDRPVGIIFGNAHAIGREGTREKGRVASPIANAILSGMVEWGLESGVSKLIVEIEPTALLRFVQLHFRPLPLGLPRRIGGQDIIARR